ncbi:hypothetical protein Tco_0931047 [Tanacetum coccineum]
MNGIGVRPPYDAKKDFTDYHLPDEWEIARDVDLNPFKDVLVFRRMVKFLGVIPINLKGNMWESEELIENMIDWNKPPKGGDGAWHTKIRLIDPDGEEFTKTLQSIPTTRMLSEKENPSEIIDLEHFHDSYECDSDIWEALKGNTRDLDSICKETGQYYKFTRSDLYDARTLPGDGVAIPSDAVRIYK